MSRKVPTNPLDIVLVGKEQNKTGEAGEASGPETGTEKDADDEAQCGLGELCEPVKIRRRGEFFFLRWFSNALTVTPHPASGSGHFTSLPAVGGVTLAANNSR
ncbi:hypothetical protein Q8A73_007352 [Channa argus]|nr:hypothetical protein Q8A73_007352 [Channa argus]